MGAPWLVKAGKWNAKRNLSLSLLGTNMTIVRKADFVQGEVLSGCGVDVERNIHCARIEI